MAVQPFTSQLADLITPVVTDLVPAGTGFDPQIRRSDHADLQADGLLPLARRLGRPPRELATAVAGRLSGADTQVDVAGPGFLNLTIPDRLLLQQVLDRLADPRLGLDRPEHGRTTVIDYSQPNIAKEMHVGHLRSTIIGDSLVRIFELLGGTVVRRNHIGDWGTQFGMLIQYQVETGAGLDDLTALYRAARARFDADPDFAGRSRQRVVALQGGDPPTLAAWREIVAASTASFSEVYDRLGVRLTPADAVGESFYNPYLPAVAADLESAGVARVSEGALCVFFDDDSPTPLIVRKRDGGFGYAATDLAAIRQRVGELGADRMLYVVDARQALHFRMVFDTARRAGWLPDPVEAVYVPFGTMLGADGRPFRTREGVTVRLLDLLAQAVDRAREVVRSKNPGIDPDLLEQRARQLGIGAVKYADLSTSRTRDVAFDLDRMVSLTGNTGVYLQYAHARTRSILAKAGGETQTDPDQPLDKAERQLALQLDGFGGAVADAAAGYEPHRLAGYLYALAQVYTTFHETCPVLTAPEPVRANRLALCRLTAETLRCGLDLLGIEAPDQI